MTTPEFPITSSIWFESEQSKINPSSDINSTLEDLIEDSISDRLDSIELQLIRIEDKLDQIAESLNL
jgi:hypothetical protein